jgi:hypothetical protein
LVNCNDNTALLDIGRPVGRWLESEDNSGRMEMLIKVMTFVMCGLCTIPWCQSCLHPRELEGVVECSAYHPLAPSIDWRAQQWLSGWTVIESEIIIWSPRGVPPVRAKHAIMQFLLTLCPFQWEYLHVTALRWMVS